MFPIEEDLCNIAGAEKGQSSRSSESKKRSAASYTGEIIIMTTYCGQTLFQMQCMYYLMQCSP